MDVLRLVGMALAAAALSIILRPHRPEITLMIGLVFGGIVLLSVMGVISSVADKISLMIGRAGLDEIYFEILLKAAGVTYLTQFGAELCRDAGEGAIASKIELVGKAAVLLLATPLFMAVLDILTALVD